MADPYYTQGLATGVQQGLDIFNTLESAKQRKADRERQARLDEAAEREREEISRLRDVQVRQAEAGLRKTEDDAAVLGTVQERRTRAVEDRAALEKEREARLANLELQRKQFNLQAAKYAKELETEAQRERFYKILPAVQSYSEAPAPVRNIITKLGAVSAGKLPMNQIKQEELDAAMPYLFGPELKDRVGKVYEDVNDLRARGYKNLPKDAVGKVLVRDVSTPRILMDENSKFLMATTDQLVTGQTKDGKGFTITLENAPATAGADPKEGPALFTVKDLAKRALEMTGVGAVHKQLEQAGVPLDQIPYWIASESARLGASVPTTRETSLPAIQAPIKPTAKDIVTAAESGIVDPAEARTALGFGSQGPQVDLSQWRVIE